MEYKKLSNCWDGLFPYDLNGMNTKEEYAPITMNLPSYRAYLGSGMATLNASGGVIPGGVSGGAIVNGQVRQNAWTAQQNVSGESLSSHAGLGWVN